MNIAEQEGELKTRDTAMKLIKQRLETWLDGKSSKSYFVYDKKVGTMIAYPDEFGSIKELNDHHFHYGYWILSAAQIALRDPNWASQWGGLIEKVIADIATTERTQSEFPYLRNFDPYEGHSWASGSALYADGNNQESSSEAINAWSSLILWGAATGNTAIRDLGIYLYSTEAHAIPYYWFNVHNNVFPKEYDKNLASFVFGGKYGTNTWWTEEPRQIHGINILPVTPASTYLGVSPEYIKKYHSVIDKAREDYGARGLSDFTPRDIWQDVLYSHLALADPEEALNKWNAKGSVEIGETRSHTLHWLGSLNEMGIPDFSTTANTALYSVFKQKNGKKTFLAFNPSTTEKEVIFSDGKRMRLSPNTLTRTHSTD
jgi:endoglucanase Acf2